MNDADYARRAIESVLLAWLVFVGIDFLFHGSILRSVWDDTIPAILEPLVLFQRIPIGYASFLVLVILVFYLLTQIHGRFPKPASGLVFGLIFGALFSINHFLALYSFVAIPAKSLIFFSLVYFVELSVVSWLIAVLIARSDLPPTSGPFGS